ncbi:hypothetical protein GCM10023176_06880 [Micromonospora coerulea]|uniref:Uncharacterized protein n=1 Tax=Micromonospora coerulea TaxID=47856 RepID=A0ABP8S8Z5_9ACTN
MAHTIASTHAREAALKMRSFLTRVSNFQVDTITTCTQSTQNTDTAVAGHLRYAKSGDSSAMFLNCPGRERVWKTTRTPNSNTRKTLRAATARYWVIMHRVSLVTYRMSIGGPSLRGTPPLPDTPADRHVRIEGTGAAEGGGTSPVRRLCRSPRRAGGGNERLVA